MKSKWAVQARAVLAYLSTQEAWTEVDWDTAEQLSEGLTKRALGQGPRAAEAAELSADLGRLIIREGAKLGREAQP